MNIPKEAIEKAIEGGWILRDGFKAYRVELLPTAHPSVGYWISEGGNKAKYRETVDWEEIALDPIFWQSLGKALEWIEKTLVYEDDDMEDGTNDVWQKTWLFNAHRFYDLVLTQKPTEAAFPSEIGAFWQELLKDNN